MITEEGEGAEARPRKGAFQLPHTPRLVQDISNDGPRPCLYGNGLSGARDYDSCIAAVTSSASYP